MSTTIVILFHCQVIFAFVFICFQCVMGMFDDMGLIQRWKIEKETLAR